MHAPYFIWPLPLHDILQCVSPRAHRRPSVSIALVVVALAGCPHELPPPVALSTPEAASSEELRWVVEGALATRNWIIRERAPGVITAHVRSMGSGDYAVIQVAYQPGAIEIRCVKWDVSPHRYDRWMQLLSSDIRKNVAQLGMGLARPPPPPPPSSPPSP